MGDGSHDKKPTSERLTLTREERDALLAITRKSTAPQRLVLRARIILLAADGYPHGFIATKLSISNHTVGKWIRRWSDSNEDEDDTRCVEDRLADVERPGTPPTYSAEQLAAIVAVACRTPESCGRPIEQWSRRELRDEVIKQGIVEDISQRHIGRILDQCKLQPHRCRYWLNPKPDEEAKEKIKNICEVYKAAHHSPDEAFFSVDEMTGIQALERIAADKPMRPGKPRAIEFEYIRHGTTCLLGAWNITDGTIAGFCNPTRKEMDFVDLIDDCIEKNPGKNKYHFVLDNLNTHQSESLVCYVAEMEGDESKLGKKGHSGILKSMKTRAQYLRDRSHYVVFHYTPKHASWLNQIEVWFSILLRKALRWASFKSVDALIQRIMEFMNYFNLTMAKPFNWRYAG